MEGTSVIFEVALAILHLVHDEILQYDTEAEIVYYTRKHTKNLYDPSKLLRNVRNRERVLSICEQPQWHKSRSKTKIE